MNTNTQPNDAMILEDLVKPLVSSLAAIDAKALTPEVVEVLKDLNAAMGDGQNGPKIVLDLAACLVAGMGQLDAKGTSPDVLDGYEELRSALNSAGYMEPWTPAL